MTTTVMDKCEECKGLQPNCLVDPTREPSARCRRSAGRVSDKLTASEAVFGFAGWLTTRDKKTVMSAFDDAAPIAELVKQFCDENGLAEPRNGWEDNLIHPCDD